MDAKKIEKYAAKTAGIIDNSVDSVEKSAKALQAEITELVASEMLRLEISQGIFVSTQPLERLLFIEQQIRAKLLDFRKPVIEYLDTYTTIEERAVAFQKKFSELDVDVRKLTPARQFVFEQANNALNGAGLAERYVTPARYLMMQQVVTGASISESVALIKRWGKGELSDGKATMGRETPSLDRYATQLARDTSYQYNGQLQEIIKDNYDLNGFIYVGDVIDNTRPLCRHLVAQGEVKFSEIDALVSRYPQGTISGTNKDNFLTYRGGYNCRHQAYAVRLSET